MQYRPVSGRKQDLTSVRRARVQRTGGRPAFHRPGSGGGGPAALLILVLLAVLAGVLYVVGRGSLSGTVTATSSQTAVTASTTVTRRTALASGQTIPFVVKAGATWTDVADELQREGLISSALVFRVQVRLTGSNGDLEAGTYQLKQGMTADQIIATLEHAKVPQAIAATFVEGWRMEQDADELQTKGVASATDFLSVTKNQGGGLNYDFLAGRPANATLEGYLFPDTYEFYKDTTAAKVVTAMLDRFGQQVTPAMRAQATAQGHTLYQVLIVASIVEREAKVPAERPLIAGVYWNRLKTGQCMCADPTVQYALGQPGNWWPVLHAEARTLAPDSPYNTYNHLGFPPGPICNPGLASIEAALAPQGDYLYFVAKGDGSHIFSRTLQEQNQNIQRLNQSTTAQ